LSSVSVYVMIGRYAGHDVIEDEKIEIFMITQGGEEKRKEK
jgi:hypothetical protein